MLLKKQYITLNTCRSFKALSEKRPLYPHYQRLYSPAEALYEQNIFIIVIIFKRIAFMPFTFGIRKASNKKYSTKATRRFEILEFLRVSPLLS